MSIELVLARHGESVWHHDNRYAGASDIELTDKGRRQGEALGRWAAGADLAAVWTSPLRRARETALPAAEQTGLDLQVDARLRELDFGVAEGLTRAEMADRFPQDLEAFHQDPVDHHFRGGEDPHEAVRRYGAVMEDLREQHDGGRVLVVAHSTALRLTLCGLLGVPLQRYRSLFPHLVNCALTEIRVGDAGVAVLALNQVLPVPAPGSPTAVHTTSTTHPGATP